MTDEKKPLSAAQMKRMCNAKRKPAVPVVRANVYTIEGNALTVAQVIEIAAKKAPKIKPATIRKRVEHGKRTWAELLKSPAETKAQQRAAHQRVFARQTAMKKTKGKKA